MTERSSGSREAREFTFPWLTRKIWMIIAPILLAIVLSVAWLGGRFLTTPTDEPNEVADIHDIGCSESLLMTVWPRMGESLTQPFDAAISDIVLGVSFLDDDVITGAIEGARARNVRVRVVLATDARPDVTRRLASAGVEIRGSRDQVPNGLILVIDGQLVIAGVLVRDESGVSHKPRGWFMCREDRPAVDNAWEWLLSAFFAGRRL